MTNEKISDEEAFETSYDTYLSALFTLASDPMAACASYGNYNVARELRDDVAAGTYLLASPACTLAREQTDLILELAEAVMALPADAVKPTELAEESLKLMSHPAWTQVRALARSLIESLPPARPLH